MLTTGKHNVAAARVRKGAGNDGVRELFARGHSQPAIVKKGAFSTLGGEELVVGRIVNDPSDDHSLALERN